MPNPTEYKRQKGLRYQQPESQNSTLWRYYTISAMLRNEMYIGTMVQGKYGSVSYKTKQNRPRPKETWYRKENTHEAIIDHGPEDVRGESKAVCYRKNRDFCRKSKVCRMWLSHAFHKDKRPLLSKVCYTSYCKRCL